MSRYIGYRVFTALFVVLLIAFAFATICTIMDDGEYHAYLLCALMSGGLAYMTYAVADLHETLDAAEMLIAILRGKLRREQAERKRHEVRDGGGAVPYPGYGTERDEKGALGGE